VVSNKDNEAPVTRLKQLKIGNEVAGKVVRINLHGAFVDVGIDVEGFVHISKLKSSPINRVEDALKVGQDVKLWVARVDDSNRRLELSMIRPVAMKWNDLSPGMHLKGKVVRLESFGAFVDVGTVRPGLVHVSEMSNDYVSDPSEVVKIGDEIQVSVIDVDRQKRQIRLTMKADEAEVIDEPLIQENIPTAMEVALRQALEEADDSPAPDKPKQKSSSSRDDQEDLLQRTLQHRVRTSLTDSS
jgi:small subunit ribosomal protein S1